jgi:ATP-dependent Clp protease ATP-binding subunit ClpC
MATRKRASEPLKTLTDLGGIDLRRSAERGDLPRAYGRNQEVDELLAALVDRRSVLLLGPSGVGKSAVLYEAIHRMIRKEAPESLWGHTVVQFSCTALEQGARNTGEWAARLGSAVEAIKTGKNIFLYLDDIWNLREAGRYAGYRQSFATHLLPSLEAKQLLLLGESTPENYTRTGMDARAWDRGMALADDHSLLAHFAVITVPEPDARETLAIVRSVVVQMEKRHGVRCEPAAVERGLELTRRFLPAQAFPGKVIRLLEEIQRQTARNLGDGEPLITPAGVTDAFSRLTGLPPKIFSDAIPLAPDAVRAHFADRVVGQEDAVEAIADRVTLIKAELHEPDRPLGVLLFLGPTGTGKTHMAKMLAEYLFGSEDRLVRFDMSEYKHYDSFPNLMRQLVDKLGREKFSVLLLDEVEKAAPYVFDLFLQAFGDGRLTDPGTGRSLDLRNALVIMTSNLGGTVKARGIGFTRNESRTDQERERLLREVEEYFRPEFINRLDNIVVFRPLDRENMRQIARRELGRALQREGVTRRSILLDFQEDVLEVLLAAGFSEAYGARPLKRAIDRLVLLPLARRIAAEPDLRDQLLEFQAPRGRIEIVTIPLGPALVRRTEPERQTEDEAEWEEPEPAPPPVLGRGELQTAIEALRARLDTHVASEHFVGLIALKDALLEELLQPSFWDDHEHARGVNQTIYHLDRITKRLLDLQRRAESLTLPAGTVGRDPAVVARLAARYQSLQREATLAELELLATDGTTVSTSGVQIQIIPVPVEESSGAESWPAVLLGMYQGWAERHGYEVEYAAGIEASLMVRGGNLAGILAGEAGVHKRRTLASKGNGRQTRTELALVEVQSLPATQPPAGRRSSLPDVARLYSFGRSHYVRDPRTGERSNRARDVLRGDIDEFLLAYLSRRLPDRAATD